MENPKKMTSAMRRELRAQAHALNPVVIIGDKGVTDELVAEIERALQAHELIKVRAQSIERSERATTLAALCDRTSAESVQTIGKIFVLFRKSDVDTPSPKKIHAGTEVTRSARRESRSASSRPASARPRRRPQTSR